MTDIELINKVKTDNDSVALNELINRHSGVYVKVAQGYSGFSDKIQIDEIKDDRVYNIYQWVMRYDESRDMKFSTFVGNMTKYMCLDLLSAAPSKTELTAANEPSSNDDIVNEVTTDDLRDQIKLGGTKVKDERFLSIFDMRHPISGPTKTWREIGEAFGISRARAHQIYRAHLPTIQQHLKT